MVLTCGTFGNVLRFLPPLVIGDDLLGEGLTILEQALCSSHDNQRNVNRYANDAAARGLAGVTCGTQVMAPPRRDMSSVGASGGRRTGALVLAIILVIIAILAAIAGIIYLTKASQSLPSYMPGRRAGNTRPRHRARVAAIAVAVIALILAGFAMRRGGKSADPQS